MTVQTKATASKAVYAWNSLIINRLRSAGIIPSDCVSFELTAAVNKPVVLHIERYATAEEYAQIADALVENGEEAGRIQEVIVLQKGKQTEERIIR